MKPLKFIFFGLLLMTSCAPDVILVGKVNMISNRNINPGDESYVFISAYQGASKQDIKKTRHKSIEDAVDGTVRQVPGGEFLTNVKIYFVKDEYYMVEGDVWGRSNNSGTVTETVKGFKSGDRVQYQKRMGTIISIVDSKECLVQLDGDSFGTKMEYEKIIKIDVNIQPNANSNSNNSNSENSNNQNNSNNNTPSVNETQNGYKVGETVKYLSKRYVPAQWVTGEIISITADRLSVVIRYYTNGKEKTETVSSYNLSRI